MSDLKVDGIIASTGSNTNLTLQGKGTGKVAIGDGALLFPDADGSADQIISTNASGVLSFVTPATAGFTLATEQATTSGSSVNFGSIPTGTKMIVVMFEGVGSTGGVVHGVQIGDAGGIETSGYTGGGAQIDAAGTVEAFPTTLFQAMTSTSTSMLLDGSIVLTLKDSANFTWVASGSLFDEGGNDGAGCTGGVKSLTAELTQVTVLTAGTFDTGSINIMYQ